MSEYVLSAEEMGKLDYLVGMALLDKDVCQRLLHGKAEELIAALDLSRDTRTWLNQLQVSSLTDLASAILRGAGYPASHQNNGH